MVRPELGLSFDSLGEAYYFYNLYSWEIGFRIRYGKSRLNAERTKSMQGLFAAVRGSQRQRIAGRADVSALL